MTYALSISACLLSALLRHRAIGRRASYWRLHDRRIRVRRALWRGTAMAQQMSRSLRDLNLAIARALPTAKAFEASLRAAAKAMEQSRQTADRASRFTI